jgi:hypothetical protein
MEDRALRTGRIAPAAGLPYRWDTLRNSESRRSAGGWRPLAGVTLSLLILGLTLPVSAQSLFGIRVTNLNRVGLTVTNYGFLGNNFISRSPSCEYPLGLGIEHMSRGGLWVGALAITDQGEIYRVSTGAIDNSQGSNQVADTEWTPREGGIVERSNLTNSRFYNPEAISEQDFLSSYGDVPGRGPSGLNSENHVPLDVRVDQEIYSFSIDPADDFVVLHYTITNEGALLRDVHVGLYVQLVSGDKNLYSTWPPSAASGAGSWYRKHYADYVDSTRLVREHICFQIPEPETDPLFCEQYEQAPYWAGAKLLGVRPGGLEDKLVSFRQWGWDPVDTTRNEDSERFQLMTNGIVDPHHIPRNDGYSPIELLSIGPFAQLPPGSSITVDFALVFGGTQEDLAENADFAQFAFDLEYRLPKPPPSPRMQARPDKNSVTLTWDASPERASDDTSPQPGGFDFQGYRVYFGSNRNDLRHVAQFDIVDTTGFDTGLESIRLPQPEIVDGDTLEYAYTIDGLKDGFTYFASVTSYDTGDDQVPSLESGVTQNKLQLSSSPSPETRTGAVTVFPNPYKADAIWDQGTLVRDHYLWFANLPRTCKITIFTVSGDLVYETDFSGDTYAGGGARGFYDPRVDLDVESPSLSGGAYAWNLITREGQAVVSGLYIYTVKDTQTGEIQRGKFLVLKSDREGF